MLEQTFELMLGDNKKALWNGTDGANAAERYVDCHDGASVFAWRVPRVALTVGIPEGC